MKIGTFLNQIERAVSMGEIPDITAGLSMLAAKGLSYVDVTSEMVDKYSVQQIKEWLSPFGLTVDSYIHCLPFNPVNEASWEFYRHDTALQLERCSELGCGFFMLVPELSEAFLSATQRNAARNQVVAYAKYVTEQASSYGIRTLIENYSYIHCPYSVPEDIEYILNRVPDLRFILDTGNFWFNDTDMEAAAIRFADRTAHVHLKDLSPNKQGFLKISGKSADSVAIGQGILPIKSVMSILTQSGYDGGLSIELNSNTNVMASLEASLSYLLTESRIDS